MKFDTVEGSRDMAIERVIVAGWTGRDAAAVQHHIAELADIGVAPPSQVPLFYRVSASLLTQAPVVQVLGDETSGEVEPLVLRSEGRLWIGLASDHTDRALETVSVAASKQICAKPVASALWDWEEVENRLDDLLLRCEIEETGGWTRYQEGALSAIRPLPELVQSGGLTDGTAMLCGTLGALGGVRPAGRYRMTLEDVLVRRSIRLDYSVEVLPRVA